MQSNKYIPQSIFICFIQFVLLTACNTATKDASKDLSSAVEFNSITYHFKKAIEQSSNFRIDLPQSGRYQLKVYGNQQNEGEVWVEDYIENKDDRTYDISGKMTFHNGIATVDGSPLAKGEHKMKIHIEGNLALDSIHFLLMNSNNETKVKLHQNMKSDQWKLVWSDEFEGNGEVDTNKWSYNVGNWGWGNNELQYYTAHGAGNAQIVDGNLLIRAKKDSSGKWTSARLTTQGKTAFTYGKIEFRAKVPSYRGCWAAAWLLGDRYVDEISWPYCGEIDILECVGYEIDDINGNGMNHGTCHTRKYYFKQGNQIGSEIEMKNMVEEYHTYGIEWDSLEIKAFVDDVHYFTYDKNKDELEWPFNEPHNIIVNLAIGGGWGGAEGIDSSFQTADYWLDYIRVYERE